jgi:regulator of extracellular matrix RemA (YlzA/DUF370 family)
MNSSDPFLTDRRTALVEAARRLEAEAGPDAAPLVDPVLAAELVSAVAQDIAGHVTARMAPGVATLEAFVHELVGGVLDAIRPWRDALQLVAVTVERITDFNQWAAIVGPWIDAIEQAIVQAQDQGLVDPDVDPRTTAMIVRDTMQRMFQIAVRFGRERYVETVERVVVAALRPAG